MTATSQFTQSMSEQAILDKAQQLLEELQLTMTQFTNTLDALTRHDVDEAAHLDIRGEIVGIVSGEGLITHDDALAEIKQAINEHSSSTQAHVGIASQISQLNEQFTSLSKRVALLEPTPPDDGMTELEKKLKAIDDYYDPTLKALMDAWNIAKMNNTGTADAIAAEHQKLAQEKAQAVADALREYTYA